MPVAVLRKEDEVSQLNFFVIKWTIIFACHCVTLVVSFN